MEEEKKEEIETPTVEPAPVVPTPEDPKKEEKKGSNKLLIIIALLVLVLGGGYAVLAYVLGGNKPAEQPKEKEEQKEEKKEEEQEDIIVEVEITDDIKELMNKYLVNTEENKIITVPNLSLEHELLIHKTEYDITKMTDSIIASFASKILKNAESELEKYVVRDPKYSDYVKVSDAKDIVIKYFDEFFGHVIEYNDNYFAGCNALHYDEKEEVYYYVPQCGGINASRYDFKYVKAEKDKNNIYVYLKYNVWDPGVPTEPEYVTNVKFTFVKKSNDNYYFLKAEPIE